MAGIDFGALEKKYGALSFAEPTQKPKTSGRGGFLTSLISEGGGAGGAALGASIGSVVPGIGTVIGAGLGGLIGGFGGRVAENKVRDDRYGVGDALKEGALSGVLGGAGEALSLAKAGKALTGEKGLANIGKNIVAGGEEKLAGKTAAGTLTKLGDKVQSSGIGALEPKAGIGAFSDEASRLATAKKYNISSGLKGLQQAEGHVATLEGKIQPLLKNTKIPVNNVISSLENAAATTLSPVAESPQLLENVKSLISRQADGDFISGDALRQIRSSLGDVFKKNSTAPIAGLQKDFYRGLGDTIGEFAPKAKSLIGEQGALFDVAEGLSKKGAGARLPIPGFLGGKSQLAGTVRDLGTDVGSGLLQKAGGLADSAIGSQVLRQAPGNLLEAGMGAQQDQQSNLSDALMQLNSGRQQDYGLGGDTQQPEQQGGISQENLIAAIQADIQQTGGKNLSQIQQLYQMFSPAAPKLNSTEVGNISDIQNGITQLQSLGNDFASSGSNIPLLGNLLAKNPLNTGAQTLQAKTALVKQIVGKALEGGVLRKEDEAKYAKILPTLNDTDAVAQQKIDAILGNLQSKLSLYQQNIGGGTSPSLQDALMQQGAY